ncbi:MAG: ABC transporter ATP-binding protein [Candidatus Sulfotelmatobacter sp.]
MKMFTLIRQLVRPYRGRLFIILIAMIVETTMSLATPWPLKVIIDNVAGGHRLPLWLRDMLGAALGNESKMHIALLAGIAVVLLAAIGAIAGYIDGYFTESAGQYVAHDLRVRTFHHLQRLSLGYYDTHQIGNLLSTITTDVQTIQNFASSSMLGILVDTLTLVSMLALMFCLNWRFTLVVLGVTPFLLFFVFRFKKAIKKATHAVRNEQANIVTVVQQALESMPVIKAFDGQKTEEDQLINVSGATVRAALAARRIKSLLAPMVSATVALCTAVVMWQGSYLILAGGMTIGALTVYLSYLTKFFKPVKDLATTTNAIAQAAVGVERIRMVLEADAIIPECEDAIEPRNIKGEIIFQNVAFAYPDNPSVLKDVSFFVKPGQRVGIVGPTGGGKSTIVSLIPRFYDVIAGKVTIDGHDVREYKLHPLRDHIGYVLQDTVLFHGTILENIAFGRPSATHAEVVEAARLANAHEFVARMPHGYDTMVGERGLTLSGGQRQRIGIARVVVRNNPILLLDEPTAALDAESERVVMDALERLMKGRTVITIAHRLATIRDADQIVVIAAGVVAENGTHQQLVARNGIYAALYRTQFENETYKIDSRLSLVPQATLA